jgi:hypothetical protein
MEAGVTQVRIGDRAVRARLLRGALRSTVRLEPSMRPNNEITRFGRQPYTSFLSRKVT